MKVLIWAKTYPELSEKHRETVCTGGVREDGSPIRLYPVPLRYLDGPQQYRLYEWIDVPVAKSSSDPRPESYKIRAEEIKRLRIIAPDEFGWAARRDLVFRDPGWQFGSVEELKAAQRATFRSLGIITPRRIEGVRLERRSDQERERHERKLDVIRSRPRLFGERTKQLEFVPYNVRLEWRCAEKCADCSTRPHDMKALDWGLMELGRREGWEQAKRRLEEISDLSTHEFRIFMGNFRLRPYVFGVVGLWYPKIPGARPQPRLF